MLVKNEQMDTRLLDVVSRVSGDYLSHVVVQTLDKLEGGLVSIFC